jgi:pyridoxal phosphate enzyme (YggS family)
MPRPDTATSIAGALGDVRARLAEAARHAHRDPASVRLIGVSKTFGADLVRDAAAAGLVDFGENRVQEGLDKIAALADLPVDWHLIGHLQSNKAKKAAGAFAWIHSIDSVDLLLKVDRAAQELGKRPRILIQVDLAHEATKHGADESSVRSLIDAALAARAVDLRGLMIVPPIPDDPEQSRPWFRRLRDLRDALVTTGVPSSNLTELSMGMSQDFPVAIEEGATMIRVGTAIFGRRPPAAAPGA